MSNIRELSDGRSDGTRLGQSATDPASFWGATPVVQPSGASQSAVSTATITAISAATAVTGGYSYSTTAEFTAMQASVAAAITRAGALTTLVNQMRSDLVTAGILKGSA